MEPAVTHEDIAELLGAYALNAVDPDEAGMVATHVAQCPRCAAELREYEEVAAMLATAGGDAPVELWDRIAEQATGPEAGPGATLPFAVPEDASGGPEPRTRRPTLRPLALSVAGIAAVIVVLLGVQVARLDTRVNHLSALSQHQGMSQAVQAALLDPDARRVVLAGAQSTGPALAELVVLPSGAGYLVDNRLPALPADETYQLWALIGGRAVSLGLLGNAPGTLAFTVGGADPSGYAITAERAGGVVAPSHAPVAQSA
ncbi:MAG TPA: anti-sigma factor [Acidimicrobiales bacterium]|nr:anti-sigma factor [Acidimicrobiales bacterium]